MQPVVSSYNLWCAVCLGVCMCVETVAGSPVGTAAVHSSHAMHVMHIWGVSRFAAFSAVGGTGVAPPRPHEQALMNNDRARRYGATADR